MALPHEDQIVGPKCGQKGAVALLAWVTHDGTLPGVVVFKQGSC